MAVLKLLRNQTLYATHEAALTAIDQMADNLHDGELWVATYGTSPNAKSILALKRTDGLTIFDNETSSDAITAVINALDATVKDGLDSVDDTQVAEGKHVGVKVVETDGKLVSISVVEDDIASAALLGTTSDTSSNQTAFGYIAKEVADRTAAIQALDKPDKPEAKKFVTSVSETDGIISVMRGSVTSTDKTITLTDGTDGGINLAVNVDGTTIVKNVDKLAVGTVPAEKVSVGAGTGLKATDAQNAFKELKSAIDDVEGAAKSYTIVKQTDGLDSKVREQYRLQQTVGSTTEFVGDTIQIYKDSSLKEVKLQGQELVFTYILDDGTETTLPVNVSTFLAESEFKDGLEVNGDGQVSVKVDESSESFLTVGANGLKLDGVSNAITNAINALNVNSSEATDQKQFITTEISETNGIVSNKAVSVVYGNYAPENQINGIAKTRDTKEYVDTVVANKNVEAEGDIYVKATASDNKVTVATQIKKLTFTQGSENTDSQLECESGLINGSDAAVNVTRFVNARIGEEIAKLDSAVMSTNGTNVEVQVIEDNGKITAVNITADSTANKDVLDAEIAARKAVDGQKGQTYAANSSSNYINNATSLNDADVKLDAALKTADDAMLTGVTGSDAITVSAKTNKNQTISLKLDAATKPAGFTNADNVLSITTEGLYLSSIIDCGTYY